MLNVFTLDTDGPRSRLLQQEVHGAHDLLRLAPIWVDLEAPTPQ